MLTSREKTIGVLPAKKALLECMTPLGMPVLPLV